MLFSKKTELELYKKQQAELLREEKRMLKALQEQEIRSKQESRQKQLEKIKFMEDKLFEELESKARRSRHSRNSSLEHDFSVNSSVRSLSTSKYDHLNRMKEIQEKARNMLNGGPYLEEIPEKISSKPISVAPSPVKIPVLIPQSMLRKAQNIPPPVIQRVLKNGDVISIHMLSENSRLNDPLVKAEAQLDENELATMSKQLKGKPIKQVISDIQNQFLNAHSNANPNARSQSMPPSKKIKNEYAKLPDAEIPKDRECSTPKERAEYYNFRDIALDVVSQQTARTWVSERMKQYSDKVKKNYLPKHSERKEIEMQILQEKLRNNYPVRTSRVKLLN